MATSLPRVAVVIPALNAERWIGDAIASVHGQSFSHERLEIVVVDDGSVDATSSESAARLAASGVAHQILRHEWPQGPGAARNRGWRAATSEWIQFLDADDLLHPAKIARQAEAAGTAGETVAVVFSKWARLQSQSEQWSPREPVDPSIGTDPAYDILRADNFMATGSQLFRRSWLERVGGYVEAYRFIEDVDLLLRIAFAGGQFERVATDDPLFLYRETPGSLAQSDATSFVDGCVRNARLAEAEWRRQGGITGERAQLLADVYFMGAHHHAARNAQTFHRLVDDIHRLVPDFAPKSPGGLRLLARMIGYGQAERVAVQVRKVKASLRGAGLSPAID
jgi:glycosyltransferase involved in cell wall biosynthesis